MIFIASGIDSNSQDLDLRCLYIPLHVHVFHFFYFYFYLLFFVLQVKNFRKRKYSLVGNCLSVNWNEKKDEKEFGSHFCPPSMHNIVIPGATWRSATLRDRLKHNLSFMYHLSLHIIVTCLAPTFLILVHCCLV